MTDSRDERQQHECDLFLLSGHHPYRANHALAEFARQGWRDRHGWGIGFFGDEKAHVLRSSDPACDETNPRRGLSREFAVAIEAVSCPVILGHLRLASRGSIRVENNHPFCLRFLGSDWLCVHNGSATNHRHLVPENERILEDTDCDTPRVFEFLRRQVVDYCAASSSHSVIEAFRHAFKKLLEQDPGGKFNLILSNGHLSIAFVHWRSFYLLTREKEDGDVALLSTIRLTESEDWTQIDKRADRMAKMLVFCGPLLILNGDIPK